MSIINGNKYVFNTTESWLKSITEQRLKLLEL